MLPDLDGLAYFFMGVSSHTQTLNHLYSESLVYRTMYNEHFTECVEKGCWKFYKIVQKLSWHRLKVWKPSMSYENRENEKESEETPW